MLLQKSVLIIVEILQIGMNPDLKYITIGSTDNSQSDEELALQAISTFKADKSYSINANFEVKQIIKFNNQDEYLKYLEFQISDYLDSIVNNN